MNVRSGSSPKKDSSHHHGPVCPTMKWTVNTYFPFWQRNVKRFNSVINIKCIAMWIKEVLSGKYHKLSCPYIIHDPPVVKQGLYRSIFPINHFLNIKLKPQCPGKHKADPCYVISWGWSCASHSSSANTVIQPLKTFSQVMLLFTNQMQTQILQG